MATLSWEYVPSKTGVPRYCQVDRYEISKKGWMKIPGTIADVEKEIILIRELKWSELSDAQRTGIYNHTLKFKTNIVGAERFPGPGKNDENRYIFQESIGFFSIRYNGGSYDLYICLSGLTPRHIIRGRPLKVPTKEVSWLKAYAQYLIDEPEILNRIIQNPVLKERWGIVDDLYRLLPTGSRTYSEPMYEDHGYPAPGF